MPRIVLQQGLAVHALDAFARAQHQAAIGVLGCVHPLDKGAARPIAGLHVQLAHAGEQLATPTSQLLLRECRAGQHLGHQVDQQGAVGAQGAPAKADLVPARQEVEGRAHIVQGDVELLKGVSFGAPAQHRGGEGRDPLVLGLVQIAAGPKLARHRHGRAGGALLHHDGDAVAQSGAGERGGPYDLRRAGVAAQPPLEGPRAQAAPFLRLVLGGLVGGDIPPHGGFLGHQVALGYPHHVGRDHLAQLLQHGVHAFVVIYHLQAA